MNSKTHIGIHRDVAMVVFVAAVFVLAIVYSVFSSTTIGDNINTGGTLTVSGASTLQHAYASSTVQATGNILGYSKLGIGTTTPGTALSVHGANTLLGGPTTIYGPLVFPYLQATSTTDSYFTGSLGIGTTTPGAALAVNGPGIFVGTSTIFGGLNLESLSATGTLGFYTRGTAAPRLVIDSSGNLGVATSGPVVTLSTVGSGYFTSGLGIGKATTGAGNLLVDELAVIEGRLGVNATTSPTVELGVIGSGYLTGGLGVGNATTSSGNLLVENLAVFRGRLGVASTSPTVDFGVVGSGLFSSGLGVGYATTGSGDLLISGLGVIQGTGRFGYGSTSPYNEVGIAGDVAIGGALGTSTLSLETTTATTGGCMEMRAGGGKWLIMYPGAAATTSGQFGVVSAGGSGLVVEFGTKRCQAGAGAAGTD